MDKGFNIINSVLVVAIVIFSIVRMIVMDKGFNIINSVLVVAIVIFSIVMYV